MTLPVSLEQAKAQLRVLDNDQDEEIDGFIRDAAAWVEDYTGHILERRTITERFAGAGPADLRAWPIAIDAVPQIDYRDAHGVPGRIATALLEAHARPARVRSGIGARWPFPPGTFDYTITIEAGYADPADVPRNMRRAMLLLIGAYDADREGGEILATAIGSAKALCRRCKGWTA